MQVLSKKEKLADLRARIETIEKRPSLAETVIDPDSQGLLVTRPGLLHEVFADDQRDTGAILGFTLGQARRLLTKERPALLVLQLSRDNQSIGIPYGVGLKSFGVDPESVVLGRMDDPIELLWAMEEAIACRAVAAVIADIGQPMKILDFTASRRLSLRAAAAGSSAFLMRYGRDREASAARYRWRVTPALSSPPAFDVRASGKPRWQVQLEKGRLGSKRDPVEWMLDWTTNGFVLAESQNQDRAAIAAGEALSRASFAALGNRLSQAG